MDSLEKLQRFRELSNQYETMTYNIIGAALEVHKQLGCGFLEAVYGEALELELSARSIPFEREKSFTIMYKGEALEQKYIADFVIYDKIVVELKAVEELLPVHKAQVINYLALTGLKLGLLVNFNARQVKPERIVRY